MQMLTTKRAFIFHFMVLSERAVMCIKQMVDLFTLDETLTVRVKFLNDNETITVRLRILLHQSRQTVTTNSMALCKRI